ncbi:RHS repeat-associated core domain-containing protein [Porphyromonas macacae]|uniref:RHS repeat-associated core domain-containing protein n=1 Tax=Porphyromonas macacae TaxID=28115 RepID=UPI0035A068BF
MYNSRGKKTWSAELDIYGCVRTFKGRSLSDCPFRYQGQYEDEETGLYYNHFRYYDPNAGNYISQDSIGLAGGISLYEYSKNTNIGLDPFGLADFYVTPNGTVVPATGYRYVSSEAPYLDELKATKTIPANPNGTYISFDNFDTPNPGALQVPHDASVKLSFDRLQVVDDLEIPKGQWGKADYLEPITKDFPEFGRGGATQAITHKEIKVDKIESLKHH